MRKTALLICTLTAAVILSVSSTFAQGDKMDMKTMPKDGMDMSKMHADGHHALMMAYHHNAIAFTRALWEMTADGSIDDIDLARAAFSEVKRSLDKMEEVHQIHMSKMGKMDAAMMEKMKPMMDKMQAEKAMLMMHVTSLGTELQQSAPRASEVEMHSAAILMRLEKMAMAEPKMAM